jgi:hypothetical protein
MEHGHIMLKTSSNILALTLLVFAAVALIILLIKNVVHYSQKKYVMRFLRMKRLSVLHSMGMVTELLPSAKRVK